MTPSQEARQILQEFYAIIGFYPPAYDCAKLHIKKIIAALDKNRGYTQCTIDRDHYEAVLLELKKFLK